MPSSITHAYFSIDLYNKLPKKCQERIDLDYLKMFTQGSDPFMFYNFFIGKKSKTISNIQYTNHTKKTNMFFKNNINYIIDNNLNNNKEILSYLYGYISHYYLDLYTHPFIYYKSGIFNKKDKSTYKYNGLHQGYEYLIDLYFINKRQNLAYYKFKPHKFLFNKIDISKELSRLIDNTFDETYHLKNTASYYKKSLNDMYLFYKYINYDPYSYKLFIYELVDKLTSPSMIKISELSFHNKLDNINYILNLDNLEWCLPWDNKKKSNMSFNGLYKLALDEAIKTIIKLDEILEKKKLDNKLIDSLFTNLSLATGLNCNKKVTMKYFEF